MSDMKCPFCQQELKYDAWNEVYMCRNPNCKHLLGFGTKELWQELINERQHATDCQDLFIAAMAQKIDVETELDRTRKVLEIAVDTLERIASEEYKYPIGAAAGTIIRIEQINETKGGDNE